MIGKLTTENLFDVQDDIREQIVATSGDYHGVIYSHSFTGEFQETDGQSHGL
jgi:hypothetical protein